MQPQIIYSFTLCHGAHIHVLYHHPTCQPPSYYLLSTLAFALLSSLPDSGQTTDTKSLAVTGDALDERPRLQLLSQHSAEKRKNQRKKGFSWMGMEGGEEWAEVEMWTEVVECRLRGAEPLIDCSGLTVALCDCHFKHTPTVYFYSCEGLLLLSLTLTLILAETLYKFLILEVQTKNSDSGISYEFGSFRQTKVFSCNGKFKDGTARKRKQIAHYSNCIHYFIRNIYI